MPIKALPVVSITGLPACIIPKPEKMANPATMARVVLRLFIVLLFRKDLSKSTSLQGGKHQPKWFVQPKHLPASGGIFPNLSLTLMGESVF
jgi:hypothetical protein